MPELPEVETVRQSLLPKIIGKPIIKTEVYYNRVLPKNELDEFVLRVQQQTVLDIRRRGKFLLFALSSGDYLVIHLRMTGRLLYRDDKSQELAKHTSARFTFADNSELHFVDQRKFGTIYLLGEDELNQIPGLRTMGPEPLSQEFTHRRLGNIVRRNLKIKAILLDQKRIAGLGNIYVDESLFRAKIHPTKIGADLTVEEVERLYVSIREVLAEAIRHQGTTIRDYLTGSGATGQFQHHLQVYGKTGKECTRCGSIITKVRVAGRGSHFCPECQKEE